MKTEEELHVELPEENEGFHTLAMRLSKSLPRDADLPGDKHAAQAWQKAARRSSAAIVRADGLRCAGRGGRGAKRAQASKSLSGGCAVGDAWTVPAVEFTPPEAKKTVILVADEGRASRPPWKKRSVCWPAATACWRSIRSTSANRRFSLRGYLFGLLLAAVGERPLGIQASQLAAVARWLQAEYAAKPATIVAMGPRSSLFSLVAAALEPKAIAGVELSGSFGSLKEIIESNGSVDQAPELYCFGLLEQFDVKQLAAIVAPRPVTFRQPGERARLELGALNSWYALLGAEFDPLATPAANKEK